MSTRKPNGTHAAHASALDPAPWSEPFRQRMAATARASCALFRGFEVIRRIQHKTAQQALAHRQVIAEKLKDPCHPVDLLALQAEVLRFDLQGAALYWQQLGAAVLDMQREILASAVPEPNGDASPAAIPGSAVIPELTRFFDLSGRATTSTT